MNLFENLQKLNESKKSHNAPEQTCIELDKKYRIYENMKYLIPFNESNLNKIVKGHNENGYIVASASRQELWLVNTAHWAVSVCDDCEVLEPQKMRDAVIELIKNNKYGV